MRGSHLVDLLVDQSIQERGGEAHIRVKAGHEQPSLPGRRPPARHELLAGGPGLVLIAGDEFGSLGGLPGSDSLLLVPQGVVQNFSAYKTASLLQPTTASTPVKDAEGNPVLDEHGQPKTETSAVTEQTLPMGPAAAQVAIKQLGTNGGGFFNVNSAHPFENPTPWTNFLEMISILLISSALCYTFGKMVGDTRQGWAVLAAMMIILVVGV